MEIEVENVVAEGGFCGAGFDFREVDFGVFEVFENGKEATRAVGGEVKSDERGLAGGFFGSLAGFDEDELGLVVFLVTDVFGDWSEAGEKC